MKPRTQAEVTEYIYDSLMKNFVGTIPIRREVLVTHLTKLLAELPDLRKTPPFDMKVESVDGNRMTISIEIRDQNLSERLEQLQGKKCPNCGGRGQRRESDGQGSFWDTCYGCSGRGVVPL